jgi:hypothetical protein
MSRLTSNKKGMVGFGDESDSQGTAKAAGAAEQEGRALQALAKGIEKASSAHHSILKPLGSAAKAFFFEGAHVWITLFGKPFELLIKFLNTTLAHGTFLALALITIVVFTAGARGVNKLAQNEGLEMSEVPGYFAKKVYGGFKNFNAFLDTIEEKWLGRIEGTYTDPDAEEGPELGVIMHLDNRGQKIGLDKERYDATNECFTKNILVWVTTNAQLLLLDDETGSDPFQDTMGQVTIECEREDGTKAIEIKPSETYPLRLINGKIFSCNFEGRQINKDSTERVNARLTYPFKAYATLPVTVIEEEAYGQAYRAIAPDYDYNIKDTKIAVATEFNIAPEVGATTKNTPVQIGARITEMQPIVKGYDSTLMVTVENKGTGKAYLEGMQLIIEDNGLILDDIGFSLSKPTGASHGSTLSSNVYLVDLDWMTEPVDQHTFDTFFFGIDSGNFNLNGITRSTRFNIIVDYLYEINATTTVSVVDTNILSMCDEVVGTDTNPHCTCNLADKSYECEEGYPIMVSESCSAGTPMCVCKAEDTSSTTSTTTTTSTTNTGEASGGPPVTTRPMPAKTYSNYIRDYNVKAWSPDNSDGGTRKEVAESVANQYGMDPWFLAAIASHESGMGRVTCYHKQKSSLTGCGWPADCSETCSCPSEHTVSDEAQFKCTAMTFRNAYNDINSGGGGIYSTKCKKYIGSTEDLWKCLLCVYAGKGGVTDCSWQSKILLMTSQWKGYYEGKFSAT